MAPRLCLPWPDQRLRTPAALVTEITDDIRDIWTDMIDTMEAMPGVGLGANQIGFLKALAVVDASDTRGQAVRLANPEVIAASEDLRVHEEGSPNLPGVSAKLKRPRVVTVRYMDETGAQVEREFADLWSTSVQHQIDHLAGRMYFDRLSKVKRDMLLRRAQKAKR
ncbi:MAG: peptide deformylase [Pseudomonadota bacterium]